MLRSLGCLVLLSTALSTAAAAAERPYLGAWDCGVATFWFTPNGYDNGSEILAVKKVKADRGSYLLTFEDGYQIALSSITKSTMTWYSGASGDSFDCKRVR